MIRPLNPPNNGNHTRPFRHFIPSDLLSNAPLRTNSFRTNIFLLARFNVHFEFVQVNCYVPSPIKHALESVPYPSCSTHQLQHSPFPGDNVLGSHKWTRTKKLRSLEDTRLKLARYIRGKPNGKLIWKTIQNGPTPHPMVTYPPPTGSTIVPAPRKNLDSEFNEEKTSSKWLILKTTYARSGKELTTREGRFCLYEHGIFSTTPYGQIYTHLKPTSLMPKTTLKDTEQSTSIVDPWPMLLIPNICTALHHPQLLVPNLLLSLRMTYDGHYDLRLLIFLSGVSKSSFHTNNRRTSSNSRDSCYVLIGKDMFARQLKKTKRRGLSVLQDKALRWSLKRKGCDAYDSTWMKPNAAVAFMANLSSTSATNNPVNEVHSNDNQIFDNVDYQLSQEMHQEEHLDSDAETEIDDNTIPYHQYLLDTEAQNVPTEVNAVFHQFEGIIKERTTQKPDYVSEWCYDYAKQFVEQQLVPFYEHFKKHIQSANETIFREVKEYEQIFDDLDAEYERCVLDNKNLTIEKKNLLIKNDCLIAECLEKDICSIVLTFDIVVPPSSNCLCEDLRSACDREHTKVLELEAEVLKQQKMVIESEKRKDDTIRNLDAQINIMKVLTVGSTKGSYDQQALETDRIQLKDTITSLTIQLDDLKVENVSLKRRYDALSKANTHSRTAYTEKINALTAENAKLKTELSGKKSGGSTAFEKPKVLALGMYTNSSKYIPPPKRANWVKPTPLPKNKQVTFQEPPQDFK
ncbi:hypothetical protein Tco_0856898 [Tanacetum coccineum]|uniref:Uncharacterized protein n=1 Tax=Tanacetum coccineum TaxID=301880 RepID=A0ABQ5B8L7_9ASTR